MHLLSDLHALIQVPQEDGSGLAPGAFLLTSLRPTAPFVFLNASLGDAGVVEERPCGCALAELGWKRRLHTIRSFEKLTVAGANFSDSQLIGILEEVMPARFGGGPADYQLIEQETPDGRPGLRLRIHPRVGRVESGAARVAFLSALGDGSGAERVMTLVWRDAGLPEVERAPPHTTRTGKVLHIHRVS